MTNMIKIGWTGDQFTSTVRPKGKKRNKYNNKKNPLKLNTKRKAQHAPERN